MRTIVGLVILIGLAWILVRTCSTSVVTREVSTTSPTPEQVKETRSFIGLRPTAVLEPLGLSYEGGWLVYVFWFST